MSIVALLLACGGSARDQLREAQDAAGAGDYDTAIATASDALATEPDEATAWGLQLVVLEAHARSGDVAAAKKQIEAMAEAHPDRVPGTLYVQTADQLKAAGQAAASIEILDLGVQRFPTDRAISRVIERSKSGGSPAELEKLRSLGYIE